MCGIGGGIALGEDAVRRMLAAQVHRGPDGCALITKGEISLGTRRLAIIDLAGGKQPMASEDGKLAVVHNGEIYNFKELGRELSRLGYVFRSLSDTEVILHAYSHWGADCVHRFRGMFAFAVYDARRMRDEAALSPTLLLFRDRLGIKPLYYYRRTGRFMFASEVRALLASGAVDRQLDPAAVWEYLGWQSVPTPRTLIAGVRLLPPGHWLEVTLDGRVSEHRYWDLLDHVSEEALNHDKDQARERVREMLHESAELHLVSDVPISVFLSGGIDSTAVVALIREASRERPRTFSVGFAETAFDERHFARAVAERFDTDHTEILLSEKDLLSQLPEALGAMDHPSGNGLNTYVVARAVGQVGLKVAISGLGGDELFAGYPSFKRLLRTRRALPIWRCLPGPLRRAAVTTILRLGGATVRAQKLTQLLAGDADVVAAYLLSRELFIANQREELLETEMQVEGRDSCEAYRDLLAESLRRRDKVGWLGWISYAEARTYMHDVLLRDTDQMGMANSLEVRVPLLDHVLAEYVVGVPDKVKRWRGTPKRLLVDSLGELLPEEIVHRRKQGFTLPMERWMRGQLRSFCEERLSPRRVSALGVLRPSAVTSLWQSFLTGEKNTSWSRLWTLVALEDWLDRNGVSA